MFEKGATVSINSPGSDLTGALARIICNVPGTNEYFVEIIGEPLLEIGRDKHFNQARFSSVELKLHQDLRPGSTVIVIEYSPEHYMFGGCQGQILGYDPEHLSFLVLFSPENVPNMPATASDDDRKGWFFRHQLQLKTI